jgi:hypothetical protein
MKPHSGLWSRGILTTTSFAHGYERETPEKIGMVIAKISIV